MENWNGHCQKNDNCKLMLIDSTNSKARVPNGLRNLVNPPNFAGKLRRYLCDNVDLYYLGANFDSCLAEFQDLHDKIYQKTPELSIGDKETAMGEAWKHLMAGAAAGAVSRTTTAPLDRLKVTLQVQASQNKKLNLRGALLNMVIEGGMSSFWRGNGVNVVKIVPEMALKFSIYNEVMVWLCISIKIILPYVIITSLFHQVKSFIKFQKNVSELGIHDRFLAGSVAGIVSQSVIFPLEVVKTRMVLRKTGESSWSCVQDIFMNRRGFYKGFLPNKMGIIPYAGIDLAVYETLKRRYISCSSCGKEPHIVVLLGFGVFSSSCALVISYPLNLLKTRFQAQRVNVEPDHSLVAAFRNILVTDGVLGLYRGISANLLKVVPSVGIGYIVYELARNHMGATMS